MVAIKLAFDWISLQITHYEWSASVRTTKHSGRSLKTARSPGKARVQLLELESLSPGKTTSNQAYLALCEGVLAGAFAPGEVLTQRSVAKTLGVSEMPVREALKQLISERALEGLPNRSARVPLLDRREVEQIFNLRELLEGRAAYLAAQNVSSHDIGHLSEIQRRIDVTVAQGNVKEYMSLNRDFHFAIYRLANDPTLISVIRMLWLRLGSVVAMSLSATLDNIAEFRRVGANSHHQMIKAFIARDSSAAEQAMRRDLIGPTKYPDYWRVIEQLSQSSPTR